MQSVFFEHDMRQARLDKLGDPLKQLADNIDFELFRETLSQIDNDKPRKSASGRKPEDRVKMFKILVIQRLYNLSDEQIEYQITDRESFRRFLGMDGMQAAPDYTTVWQFRERLTETGLAKKLFDAFTTELEAQGLVLKKGTIVDSSFVEVPRQRNTREENELIKQGQVPEAWEKQPHKLSQKDLEARWTKKNKQTYHGYKNHVKVDAGSGLIRDYTVSDAAVHDSQKLPELIDGQSEGESLFADSAYKSKQTDEKLAKLGVGNYIHEKAGRNRPLSKIQKRMNQLKSGIRCRVEHIFGLVENSMGGPELEYIGIKRIGTAIGLMNLVCNLVRYGQLKRQGRARAGACPA